MVSSLRILAFLLAVTLYFKHLAFITVCLLFVPARDQVLAKGDHSITIENQLVKLKVFKPGVEGNQTEETSRAVSGQNCLCFICNF